MKRFLLLFTAILIFFGSYGQDTPVSISGPVISWETPSHDFGDIKEGERVETTFKFTNSGSSPLVITNVEVTCGCTTPKGWPRDPIMPGEKGELTVAFNSAGKYGRQNKVIKVISNAGGEKNQVMFSANVLVKE
jgi:hypothetical protein